MRLFSYQAPDYDFVNMPSDPARGSNTKAIQETCRILYRRLNWSGGIWCYDKRTIQNESGRTVEWELEVPDKNVVLINNVFWHAMIGTFFTPAKQKEKWWAEAKELSPGLGSQRAFVTNKTHELMAQIRELPKSQQLDRLLACEGIDTRDLGFVIPAPAKAEWVVRHGPWQ